ncbi:hypothetical protein A6A06_23550 [Streptomyces sp. CB02923]|uniref:phage tail domain-containing protein n=1 Tax=Streptomyces sp. CB02923 TaxID=1718985 RepID=UPI00093A59C0|nr:phage tail domain-containing protein [Streptomyces sp. CB02923]OKH99998.1 hypothetical protein A6A06_23550 [Streptomyces sp. CB02923]
MAELGDWTCEYNGLLIGAPDSATSLVSVDGLLSLPDVRSADLALVQRHGLYPGDDYMGGRAVTLTLEVYGRTREEFTTALNGVYAAFGVADKEKPLRFRFPGVAGDRTAFVNARPRKRAGPLDLNFAYRVCNIVVELFATDPYLYGDALETKRLSSPWEGAEPRLWFKQVGSVPALPVIKLTGSRDCVLRDEVTGNYFGMANVAGDITIDAERRTLTATGGGPSLTDKITPGSEWPEFAFGDHRLTLASAAVGGPTTAEITWRNRWA